MKTTHRVIAEVPRRQPGAEMTIGNRTWDVCSHYCTLNQEGDLEKWLTYLPPPRLAMGAGTHSIWISEQLQELGHEVIVANGRELRAINHSDRKSDHADAVKLARYARLDPKILRPIAHRTVEQPEALMLIRARDLLIRLSTAAMNAVRGLMKPCGYRLTCLFNTLLRQAQPGSDAAKAGLSIRPSAPADCGVEHQHQAVRPADSAAQSDEVSRDPGIVENLWSWPYYSSDVCLDSGEHGTIPRSRDAGCYLGLRPRRCQSGD